MATLPVAPALRVIGTHEQPVMDAARSHSYAPPANAAPTTPAGLAGFNFGQWHLRRHPPMPDWSAS